jgi:hypothetical protein
MKKSLFVLTILLFTLGLAAQTGLLGLSYGQSVADAEQTLTKLGYTQNETVKTQFVGEIYTLPTKVDLYYEATGKHLLAWMISIEVGDVDDYELETVFIEDLAGIHGDEFAYDPYFIEAYWKLNEHQFLNSGFDADFEQYIIFYGDTRHEDIMPY